MEKKREKVGLVVYYRLQKEDQNHLLQRHEQDQ